MDKATVKLMVPMVQDFCGSIFNENITILFNSLFNKLFLIYCIFPKYLEQNSRVFQEYLNWVINAKVLTVKKKKNCIGVQNEPANGNKS